MSGSFLTNSYEFWGSTPNYVILVKTGVLDVDGRSNYHFSLRKSGKYKKCVFKNVDIRKKLHKI